MITSRFFIENKEVIVLGILLAIVGVVILEIIFEIADRRVAKKRIQKLKEAKRRQAIYNDAMLWRKQKRENEYKEYKKNFKKFYLNNVVNF